MFDEYSGWETNPESILFQLRGLPTFPKSNLQPDTKSQHAAFATTTGPASFIHEVIMLPAKCPEAPDEIFMLLEEARLRQNVGHYDVALSKLHTARILWEDKSAWAIMKESLDPITVRSRAERARERIAMEEARDQEFERRLKENEMKSRAEDESRRVVLEAEARLAGNLAYFLDKNDVVGEETRLRENERQRQREEYAREKAQRELRMQMREGQEEAQALHLCSIEAQTTLAQETEFYVYLYLSIASIYESSGDTDTSLTMNWRAYTVYKRFLEVSRAQPALIHTPQPSHVFSYSLVEPLKLITLTPEEEQNEITLHMRIGLGSDQVSTFGIPSASTSTTNPNTTGSSYNNNTWFSQNSSANTAYAVSEEAAKQGLYITIDDVSTDMSINASTHMETSLISTWADEISRVHTSNINQGKYIYPINHLLDQASTRAKNTDTDTGCNIEEFMHWTARQRFQYSHLQDIDILHGACPLLAVIFRALAGNCYRANYLDLTLNCLAASRACGFLCISPSSPQYADMGIVLNNIGACLYKLKYYIEARIYFEAALNIFESVFEPYHPRVTLARANYNHVLPHASTIIQDKHIAGASGNAAFAGAASANTDVVYNTTFPLSVKSKTSTTSTMAPTNKSTPLVSRPLVTSVYQRMLLDPQSFKKPKPVVDEKDQRKRY